MIKDLCANLCTAAPEGRPITIRDILDRKFPLTRYRISRPTSDLFTCPNRLDPNIVIVDTLLRQDARCRVA